MANKKTAKKNRLEQIKQLEKDIIASPDLLKEIILDPKKAISKLDYLDDELKSNIGNLSLFEVVTGLTGVLDPIGAGPCASGDTCHSTCGYGTCSDTCGGTSTCSDSCRGNTCNSGCTYSSTKTSELLEVKRSRLEQLILFSNDTRGFDTRSFKTFRRM